MTMQTSREMTALLFDLAPSPEHRKLCIDYSLHKPTEQREWFTQLRTEYPSHKCHEYSGMVDVEIPFTICSLRVRFLLSVVGEKKAKTTEVYVVPQVTR